MKQTYLNRMATLCVVAFLGMPAMAQTYTKTAPETSTAAAPKWFKIMNAHTSETRKERCISWDGTTLLADKPADFSDRFLWRLEASGDGETVKLISKTDGLGLSDVTTAGSTMSDAPAEFVIVASNSLSGSVTNGSYAIELNGDNTQLLNAQDASWKIVTYNAGFGTGSGWYFYLYSTSTGISENEANPSKVFISNGKLEIVNAPANSQAKVFNAAGQLLQTNVLSNTNCSLNFKQSKGVFFVQIEQTNGTINRYKVVNN